MATKITTPELFNLSSNNTAATQLPVFTTSTRPTPTTSTVQVDYLVVAGGGAGGGSALGNFAGGGGGAGGVRTSFTPVSTPANYTILPTLSSSTGTAYNITVGAGGIGVASASTKGGSGANSVFETITATGGGGGGVGQNDNGLTGGSAGGTAPTTSTRTNSVSPTQGFRGGGAATGGSNYGSGGGGGGGAEGVQGTNSKGGNGGIGFQTAITETATYYAGGGGGGTYKPPSGATSEMGLGGLGGGGDALVRSVGEPGTNGLGGGGGAATNGDGEGGNRAGGDGGSGIVILRYPTSSSSAIKTTGSLVYTESTGGSDTVIRFTEGSGNVSFASVGIAVGEMIFNSTTEKVEYWDGFQWNMIKDEVQSPPVLATSTLYLDASNTTSYPGTGSTWFDISGNSHNGSISGPIFNSGGWFDYDGTSDVVSIPSSTVFNATSSNSVSMGGWFYMTASQLNSFWSKGSGSGSLKYEYFCFARTDQGSNNYINFNTYLSGGGQVALNYTNSAVTNNTWYHVIVTIDTSSQSAKLYVNGGAPKATDTSFSASSVGTAPLLIGRRGDLSWDLQGRNSKFNFWSNKILTQAEVQSLYDYGP